jgi:hypothetical protein
MPTADGLHQGASPTALAGEKSGYTVILTTDRRGEQTPDAALARELVEAFQSLGLSTRVHDYTKDVRQVSSAMADAGCLFFVCFNGFGSELLLTTGAAGHLVSAFEHFRKPLFDLVTECPVHDDMRHQIESTGRMRNVLTTDSLFVWLSRLAGTPNVRTVPAMSFPSAVSQASKPHAERSIDVLLPIDVSNADSIRARHAGNSTYQGRVYREIFESVVEHALSGLEVDPLIATLVACQDAGIAASLRSSEFRFLLSSVVDFVDARRQDMLLKAIRHLPISVFGHDRLGSDAAYSGFSSVGDGSFASLLQSVANSKTVICQRNHRGSHRERAMAAFTAGALVVASADDTLESQFVEGADMLTYRNVNELARVLESLFDGRLAPQQIAASGQAKVSADMFSPRRLASMILTLARRAL